MLPKVSAYVKSYDGGTKWMHFLIKYDKLLKRYNDIWNKVLFLKKIKTNIHKCF